MNAIIEEEVHREIIAAIDKLPPERRRVVELSMVGYSQEEIAEKLNISVNTVKTQKRKAYAFLPRRITTFVCSVLNAIESLISLIYSVLLLDDGEN